MKTVRATAAVTLAWLLIFAACGKQTSQNQSESSQTPAAQTNTNAEPGSEAASKARAGEEPTSRETDETRRALAGTNQPVTIPAGTVVLVRVNELLGSDVSHAGETFDGVVASPVALNGYIAIPAGTAATGTVVSASSAGHLRGRSELELRLTGLRYNDQNYDVQSKAWVKLGTPRGKRSVEVIGGGAGLGALIGAIAGGGKGAAIGAAAGAGAGTATQELTKPGQVRVPPETVVPFQLTAPLQVRAATARLR